MHDFAHAILVFLELLLALGVTHLLEDDLLGSLGGDASEIDRRQRFGDHVARLGSRIADLRFIERDLGSFVLDLVDDRAQAMQARLARLRIDLGLDLVVLAIARLRSLLDRLFHRRDDDLLVDGFFTGYRVRNLQKLKPVCTDSHGSLPRLR